MMCLYGMPYRGFPIGNPTIVGARSAPGKVLYVVPYRHRVRVRVRVKEVALRDYYFRRSCNPLTQGGSYRLLLLRSQK